MFLSVVDGGGVCVFVLSGERCLFEKLCFVGVFFLVLLDVKVVFLVVFVCCVFFWSVIFLVYGVFGFLV